MRVMNSFLPLILSLFVTVPCPMRAQVIVAEPKEGIHSTSSDLSGPHPLFELPADIPSEPGATACHAHVKAISNGFIPIFLINRSDATTSISLIGADTALKAHRKLDNGKWERIQASNGWVMCADSIRELAISQGKTCRFLFWKSLETPRLVLGGTCVARQKFPRIRSHAVERSLLLVEAAITNRHSGGNQGHGQAFEKSPTRQRTRLHGYLALNAEKRVFRDARKCRETTART